MAEPLRHRQTKEAATDMFSLQPPRYIPTLPVAAVTLRSRHHGSYRRCCGPNVVLDGGRSLRRSRGRQRDCERVAAQHHERDQPPDKTDPLRSSWLASALLFLVTQSLEPPSWWPVRDEGF